LVDNGRRSGGSSLMICNLLIVSGAEWQLHGEKTNNFTELTVASANDM